MKYPPVSTNRSPAYEEESRAGEPVPESRGIRKDVHGKRCQRISVCIRKGGEEEEEKTVRIKLNSVQNRIFPSIEITYLMKLQLANHKDISLPVSVRKVPVIDLLVKCFQR